MLPSGLWPDWFQHASSPICRHTRIISLSRAEILARYDQVFCDIFRLEIYLTLNILEFFLSPIPWPQEGNWSSPGRQSRSRIHCSFPLKSIQCYLVSLKLILECKLLLIIMKLASNSPLAQPIQPDDVEECSQRFHFRFTVLAVVRSFFGAQAWIGMPQNRRTARHRKFTISVTVFTIRSSRELFFCDSHQ